MRKTVTKIECVAAAAAAFALSASAFFLGGCSGKVGLRFAVDGISITVGEERDLFPYAIFEPTTAADKSFALSSSDGGIVEVDGTVVRGVGKGTAVVTAADGAEIAVSVSYRAPQELYVEADGTTVRTLDDISDAGEISFTAELDGYADPDTEIFWETDGARSGSGDTFTLEPTRYGEYDVCAIAGGLAVHTPVRLYRPTEAYAVYDGELVQNKDFTPVVFHAIEVKDSRDAESTVEWRVNGELCGTSHSFRFTPSADGEYRIELAVNGMPRAFSDGAEHATVIASGGRAPSCAVEFDADGVYITWRDGGGATAVSVTVDGKRTVYERTDGEHAYRFGGGRFDATGLIEPCAAEPESYTVAVVADGRGDDAQFLQYGAEAAEFIQKKLFIGNLFANSAERAAEIVGEAYACGRRSVRAYLGRNLDADDARAAFLSAAEKLGLTATVDLQNRIATVEFSPYVNSPAGDAESAASAQMYAELPHIEYDAASLRGDGYYLAVERLTRSVEVDNTEKLLSAVSRGYKPIATGAARTAYARARNALLNIIGRDYDAYKKAHAIYDWLQFVTFRTEGEDGAPCNFIDGIFGAVSGGAVRSGMSDRGLCKTFALMCGMEGIPCSVEVGADGGYYNAVTIDGAAYCVDVYGGETGGGELGLADAHAELTSHGGLFIGRERAGISQGSPYLVKSVDAGVYFDKYIDVAERADSAQIAAAVRAGLSSQALGAVSVYTPMGVSIFQTATLGAELALDPSMSDTQAEAVRSSAVKAAVEYVKARFGSEPGNVRSYTAQDKLFIIVPVPSAALPHAVRQGV